ncbi:MAG: hypothetical protein RLO38_22420 [Roseovarius confluentis]|uniref:hypothetical protein n=1 Tax=Roseovarius sp. TaxID=1486281 RepID=UPI0032EFD7A7
MTRRAMILTMAMAVALSGCGFGQSRLNPFNWFRSGPQTETLAPVTLEQRQDNRPLVALVTELTVERTPGGAIIRAAGLPPQQGWYDAELVNEDRDGRPIDGVLTYSFRARPPLEPTRVSTVQSRELTVAVFVSEITLAGTREIRVTGSQNSRAARR